MTDTDSGDYGYGYDYSYDYVQITQSTSTYTWAANHVTVTSTDPHLMSTGQKVLLDFTSGDAVNKDGTFTVSVIDDYSYSFVLLGNGAGGDVTVTRVQRNTWEESTWYGKTTYYCKETLTTPYKDIHVQSVRADRDIGIAFIGYEAGDTNIRVTITSVGSVLVNDSIQNPEGTTSLTTSSGQLRLINDTAVVGGRNISLGASTGIGADRTLRTNLNDGYNGSLNAVTTTGDISIQEISGDLIVDQVTTSKTTTTTTSNVTLTAHGDILGKDASNLVRGQKVTLTATYGDIGTLGTGGTAATPGAGAQALRIDTGDADDHSLTATAVGDVNITETTGTLHLNSVVTDGSVRITVEDGGLTDANSNEVRDDRTWAQLLALYERMMATGDAADESVAATIAAYEALKTQEYQTYWRYRNSVGGSYDASQTIALSDAEIDWYTDYYAGQGKTAGEIAIALQTLVNARTASYHVLHRIYGDVSATYDSTWSYDVDSAALHDRVGSAEISGSAIELTRHVFTTARRWCTTPGAAPSTGSSTEPRTTSSWMHPMRAWCASPRPWPTPARTRRSASPG